MVNKELMAIAERACQRAKKAGAQQAAGAVKRSHVFKVKVQNGKLEELKASVTRGLSLRVFVDGRYGSHSTSDLEPASLDRFIDSAVEMTRYLMPDPHRSLPDPALYKGRSSADLGLYDPAHGELTMDQRKQVAMALHDEARQRAGDKVISVEAGISDRVSEWVRFQTNGFSDGDRSTYYGQWASVSIKDPSGRRPSDWAESMARRRADLATPAVTGAEAASRTLEQLGADKVKSLTLPLIVEARAVYRVLGGLLAPLSGRSVDQKRSCMDGKIGKRVAAPLLSITDDPLLSGGWSSRRFDGEGLSSVKRPLVDRGVLRNFYVDTYYGKKLKQAPTSAGASNLVFSKGRRDLDGLCNKAGKAVLITRFIGGNSNSTTGDFSHGIAGFLIDKGKRGRPLASMNISGNHLAFWRSLRELGNDPYPHSPYLTPSLLLAPALVAGK